MEENVTQRVRELIKAMAISENKFSQTLQMKQNTLNKQLADGGCGVSITTVLLILDFYKNVSAEWLLRGTGSMFTDEQEQLSVSSSKTLENMSIVIKSQQETISRISSENEQLREELRKFYSSKLA